MANLLNIATPDSDAGADIAVSMREFPFGDGYSQRVANDINFIKQTWPLSWTHRSEATIAALDDFFRENAGKPFTWVTPRGETLRLTCDKWSPRYPNATDCSITATLVQSYEP